MSKEIKYKAYVPELNRTVDVYALCPMNKSVFLSHQQLYGTPGDDVQVGYSNPLDDSDTRVNLREYTGLKDKNDVEIYEGDVVNIVDLSSDYTEKVSREKFAPFIVEWSDVLAGWYPKSINGYEPDESWWDQWEVEVIGNIYENPDLLEKNK